MQQVSNCLCRNIQGRSCVRGEHVSQKMGSNADRLTCSCGQGQTMEQKTQQLSDIIRSEVAQMPIWRSLCWLLAVSVRQMRPLRTPYHVSRTLPIPQMSGRMRDAFTSSSSQRGNVHCAEDSHLHHAFDTLLPSVAPPSFPRLDQTIQHRSSLGNADRPC